MHSSHTHSNEAHSCASCLDLLGAQLGRRRFLQVTAAGLASAAAWPLPAIGATGNYEAMVLACIDPRFQELVSKYTAGRKLTGKYSQFVIAGAAIGVVAPAFKDWHKTFWDNLGASIQLHNINKVIVVNHRDCGAAKIAFGADAVKDSAAETRTHQAVLAEFRKQLKDRHPKLGVETGLMALNGKIEVFS